MRIFEVGSPNAFVARLRRHRLLSGYSRFPVHAPGEPHNFIGLLLIKKVSFRPPVKFAKLNHNYCFLGPVDCIRPRTQVPRIQYSIEHSTGSMAHHQLLPSKFPVSSAFRSSVLICRANYASPQGVGLLVCASDLKTCLLTLILCSERCGFQSNWPSALALDLRPPGEPSGALGVVTLEGLSSLCSDLAWLSLSVLRLKYIAFSDIIEEMIEEEIVDETDRYESNQSKRRAKRMSTATVMKG